MATVDIHPGDMGDPSWGSPEDDARSLAVVYERVHRETTEAIDWYLRGKRRTKRVATNLRFWAILIAGIGGLIPAIGQIPSGGWFPEIPPILGTIALGVAALLVALDRFFGYSGGWMRFIGTEMQLQTLLRSFEMEWLLQRARWSPDGPDGEQTITALARLGAFRTRVASLVEAETHQWMAEFRSRIQAGERETGLSVADHLGAVNVEIHGAEGCEDGWELFVGGTSRRRGRGKRAAVTDLAPGTVSIRAVGRIQDRVEEDEIAVVVTAGQVVDVRLTLG